MEVDSTSFPVATNFSDIEVVRFLVLSYVHTVLDIKRVENAFFH